MTEALDTSSSPATLALAKAVPLKRSFPLKTTFGAPASSLQSMLAMAHLENDFTESEEDNVAFPSIEWNLDEDNTAGNSSGDPLDALTNALAILKNSEDFHFRMSAKRRRMGEPCMVRSKAVKTQLSSLATSCAKESMMSMPKFVIGNWGSMVGPREVTSSMATCTLKTTLPFVDTNTVSSSLLIV
jgi:hypothetical protein